MSPRLSAVAHYHRFYRRLIREAGQWPDRTAQSDERLHAATITYRAMVVEAHPEKAVQR
jgi:hypothetical protein